MTNSVGMWPNSPLHTPASHRLHLRSGHVWGRRSWDVSNSRRRQPVVCHSARPAVCFCFVVFLQCKLLIFFLSGLCGFVMLQANAFTWGSVSHWIVGDKCGRSPLVWSRGTKLPGRDVTSQRAYKDSGVWHQSYHQSHKDQTWPSDFDLQTPNWPHLLRRPRHHFITSFQFHLWPLLWELLYVQTQGGGRSHGRRSLLELLPLFSFLFSLFFTPLRTDGSQLIVNLIFEMFLEVCGGTMVF